MASRSKLPLSQPSGRRKLFYRLAAVALGLLPFFVGEAVCRSLGWGRPEWEHDPLVGFESVEPLFELNAARGKYEVRPERQVFFCSDSFAERKANREFRIFCLGGSTVQGRPYARETSFTTWLELSLQAAAPDRGWRVVNCGGVSYASYRLVPILQEVLTYEPDLIILYTGHNEFLESRSYGRLQQAPEWVANTYRLLRGSRMVGTLLHAIDGNSRSIARDARPLLPTEVDTLLDHEGGLEAYRRDDAWQRQVVEHYRLNLERMAAMCRDAPVPLILVDPVSNVADCPPFKWEIDDQLNAADRDRIKTLWEEARDCSDLAQRADLLRQVLARDSRHAAARFQYGKCLQSLQQDDQAQDELLRAKDDDLCPLRMLEIMHRSLRQFARQQELPLVEVRRDFVRQSEQGLVGNQWMVDHVHPSIRGHQRIAELLFQTLAEEGYVAPREGWEAKRDDAYRKRFGTLDTAYFARGKERLEGLRRWAAGRSSSPIDESSP